MCNSDGIPPPFTIYTINNLWHLQKIRLLVWIYIEIEYFWFRNGMRNKSFGLDMYQKNCIFGLEMLYFYLFLFGLLKISCIFAAYFKR